MFRLFLIYVLFQATYQKPILKQDLRSTNSSQDSLNIAKNNHQHVTKLAATGSLNVPRCGRPPNVPHSLETGKRWRQKHLTYTVYNWSEPFTKLEITSLVEDCIQMWTESVDLRITESNSNVADIVIQFTKMDKEDFLGYALYPDNGDIFINKEKHWSLTPRDEIYLGWVVCHELGHSLGLPHSNSSGTIMSELYSNDVLTPSVSDIEDLVLKYGPATLNSSILCKEPSVDAILNTTNPLVIKGNQYWKLSNGVLKSGPFPLDELFPGLPDPIDAAFRVGKTNYFLSNYKFYRFKGRRKTYSTKLISIGFDGVPTNIDASFYDPRSSIIYFFKGSKYYALNTKKRGGNRLTVNGKNISSDWDGLPQNIEAATLISSSQVLFVRSPRCYVIDLNSKQLLSNETCSSTLYKC